MVQERIDVRKSRASGKDWATLHWLLFALCVIHVFAVVGIWALVLT